MDGDQGKSAIRAPCLNCLPVAASKTAFGNPEQQYPDPSLSPMLAIIFPQGNGRARAYLCYGGRIRANMMRYSIGDDAAYVNAHQKKSCRLFMKSRSKRSAWKKENPLHSLLRKKGQGCAATGIAGGIGTEWWI
jgi:hypothetical protein